MKIIDIKNYGFVPPIIDDTQYILGGLTKVPKVILQPNGDWSDYLPEYEPQFNEKFDSTGCTVWGTENVIETLLKKKLGIEYNFSERYIYILAKVRPPGADPHKIAEVIRSEGLIPDELLPMTPSFEEFIQPDPMRTDLLVKGQLWPYKLMHEWVWERKQTREQRKKKIREALKYSPLGVSVTAWIEEDGVYIDDGRPNTHWTVIYGEADNGWKVFDSYDHSNKILSFDHDIRFCKRYFLGDKPMTTEVGIDLLKRIIEFLSDIIEKMKNSVGGLLGKNYKIA